MIFVVFPFRMQQCKSNVAVQLNGIFLAPQQRNHNEQKSGIEWGSYYNVQNTVWVWERNCVRAAAATTYNQHPIYTWLPS